MKLTNRIVAMVLLAAAGMGAIAQTSHPTPPAPLVGSIANHPGWPDPKPEDVTSPEAIVAAVYNVISGGRISLGTGTVCGRCFCRMRG